MKLEKNTTTKEEILEGLKEITFWNTGADRSTVIPELTIAGLIKQTKSDSLDNIEAIMGIEEEFDIEVSDEEMESFKDKTVGDVVDFVFNKLEKSG